MQMMPMMSWDHGFAKTELLGAGVAGEAIEGSSYVYNGLGHTPGIDCRPGLSFVYNVCGISDQVNRQRSPSELDPSMHPGTQVGREDPPWLLTLGVWYTMNNGRGTAIERRSPEES